MLLLVVHLSRALSRQEIPARETRRTARAVQKLVAADYDTQLGWQLSCRMLLVAPRPASAAEVMEGCAAMRSSILLLGCRAVPVFVQVAYDSVVVLATEC